MNSSRPYLVRAIYEWIVDNDCTPYLLVDATCKGVEAPQEYVKDGQIVLNVAPKAVLNMEMNNEFLAFNARFGGVPTDILVPTIAIKGIYAKENGRGMVFEEDEQTPPDGPEPEEIKKPSLRVVK